MKQMIATTGLALMLAACGRNYTENSQIPAQQYHAKGTILELKTVDDTHVGQMSQLGMRLSDGSCAVYSQRRDDAVFATYLRLKTAQEKSKIAEITTNESHYGCLNFNASQYTVK